MAGSKVTKYFNLLKNLLPPGRLWTTEDKPNFKKLLETEAIEFCRVDDRVAQMFLEIDPRTATDAESLDTWEGILGLPDECTPDGQSEADRQIQATQKLTNIGGNNKAYFEFLITQLGFPGSTVYNWLPFTAGSKAGDKLTNFFNEKFVAGSLAGERLSNPGWRYYFNADIPAAAATVFVAGSLAGEPLRTFSNELIECTLKKLKPAHAGITFSFFE